MLTYILYIYVVNDTHFILKYVTTSVKITLLLTTKTKIIRNENILCSTVEINISDIDIFRKMLKQIIK